MAYASEDLVREHINISLSLDILEKMAHAIKQTGKADMKDIEHLLNYFRTYTDKYHDGKEEGFLFPAMEECGIVNKGGPIGKLLAEHNEARQCVRDMTEAAAGGKLQVDKFVQAATVYIQLMRAHI